MQCEICGKPINKGIKVKVEGSKMTVCQQCSNLGSKIQESKTEKRNKGNNASPKTKISKKSKKRGNKDQSFYDEMGELVSDYNKKIQRARENKDLKQDELAQKINEKASLIGKLERGDKLPEEKVVKKLENYLNIELKES